jgi:crotonobetainyl-CoA:carnitine CoA-transferase CaiB-like acyl-CoA transferase
MFDDPHLVASGGLTDVTLPDGRQSRLPTLPVEMNGQRPGKAGALARPGEHTREVLQGLGLGPAEIAALEAGGAVAGEVAGS